MAPQTQSAIWKEWVRSSRRPVTIGASEASIKLPKFCRADAAGTFSRGAMAWTRPQPEVPANCRQKRAALTSATAPIGVAAVSTSAVAAPQQSRPVRIEVR